MSLNFGLKKGSLAKRIRVGSEIMDCSQMTDSDKNQRPQEEKKLKKPCIYETIQDNCLDMEEIWLNFALQLERFEDYCIDVLRKMESKTVQKASLDRLFTNVLATIVKDKYHHPLVFESKVIQGHDVIAQVNVLEVQHKDLLLEIVEFRHKIEDLTNMIKHLEGQNLKLENQLKGINQ